MLTNKRIIAPLLIILPLITFVLLGPQVEYPPINPEIKALALPLSELDTFLLKREAKVANLRPDNQSRIVWADSIRKTPYSIVYLHGFSASPAEGDPIHYELAERYGANLYLPRLAQHGIRDIESFGDLTPQELVDSAKEAIAIGQLLGDTVIVMSCSTGSTLSIYLAAHNPDFVDAMLLFSPNIELGTSLASLLTAPWGVQLARQIEGKYRSINSQDEIAQKYWTTRYRTEGAVLVQYLIEQTMTEDVFGKITQPFLAGYWYKNEEESDHVISIDRIQEFYVATATPKAQKKKVAFPEAGTHVMLSKYRSKDLDSVREVSTTFMEQVLGLTPKKQ
jgi:pimeloyl-ACP methyl ester carboxylesterase